MTTVIVLRPKLLLHIQFEKSYVVTNRIQILLLIRSLVFHCILVEVGTRVVPEQKRTNRQ